VTTNPVQALLDQVSLSHDAGIGMGLSKVRLCLNFLLHLKTLSSPEIVYSLCAIIPEA
jgi:hypothetical protein